MRNAIIKLLTSMRIWGRLGLAALQCEDLIDVTNVHRIQWVGKDGERGANGWQ